MRHLCNDQCEPEIYLSNTMKQIRAPPSDPSNQRLWKDTPEKRLLDETPIEAAANHRGFAHSRDSVRGQSRTREVNCTAPRIGNAKWSILVVEWRCQGRVDWRVESKQKMTARRDLISTVINRFVQRSRKRGRPTACEEHCQHAHGHTPVDPFTQTLRLCDRALCT